MAKVLNLSDFPERDRMAFYGALLSIAFLDGSIDSEKLSVIFGVMDVKGITTFKKENFYTYIVEPPKLWNCLSILKSADEQLRYGLMINLVDVAWADGKLHLEEGKAIGLAQQELRISQEELEAIQEFVRKMRKVRRGELSSRRTLEYTKTAISGLSAIGVPISAIGISGSVAGFSAAGITSGLAALGSIGTAGLAAGMIPGVAVAIVSGGLIFAGVNKLLGTGSEKERAQIENEKERRKQMLISNVKGFASQLSKEISNLQNKKFRIYSLA